MERPEIGAPIGSGLTAEVFAYGAHVLKLYRSPDAGPDALREAAATAIAAAHGLPVPQVVEVAEFEGRWGVVMGRAAGQTLAAFAEGTPLAAPSVVGEMVRLHRLMHGRPEARLPSLKARIRARIGRAEMLDAARRSELVAGLDALPEGDCICHGDFHPFNIIGVPGSTVIVDWLDATSGPPAADVCRSYVLLAPHRPDVAEDYLARYCAASGLDRAAIVAWLPYVAAARLVEGAGDTQFLLGLLGVQT